MTRHLRKFANYLKRQDIRFNNQKSEHKGCEVLRVGAGEYTLLVQYTDIKLTEGCSKIVRTGNYQYRIFFRIWNTGKQKNEAFDDKANALEAFKEYVNIIKNRCYQSTLL